MSGMIQIETPTDAILRIVMDCPPANALGAEPLTALVHALEQAENDHRVRAVVLAGREGAFCAGADLRGLASATGWEDIASQFARAIELIEHLRVPVIAEIDGHCMGGGFEMALACDIRLASERAFFVGAAVNVGLVASVGRLPRLIGVARAKAVLLTGERIDAATALQYGIVTQVHAEKLQDAALQLAERISTRAPLSVEASKRLLNQVATLPSETFDAAFQRELETLVNSNDHKEALRAFPLRQKPEFTRT